MSPETPLKGEVPKGSGLDKFLSSQSEEIVLRLQLVKSPNKKLRRSGKKRSSSSGGEQRNESEPIRHANEVAMKDDMINPAKKRNTDQPQSNNHSACYSSAGDADGREGLGKQSRRDDEGITSERISWGGRVAGTVGEARLGLGQFRNGHIEKVRTRADGVEDVAAHAICVVASSRPQMAMKSTFFFKMSEGGWKCGREFSAHCTSKPFFRRVFLSQRCSCTSARTSMRIDSACFLNSERPLWRRPTPRG